MTKNKFSNLCVIVTGPTKTGHISTKYTHSENGTSCSVFMTAPPAIETLTKCAKVAAKVLVKLEEIAIIFK